MRTRTSRRPAPLRGRSETGGRRDAEDPCASVRKCKRGFGEHVELATSALDRGVPEGRSPAKANPLRPAAPTFRRSGESAPWASSIRGSQAVPRALRSRRRGGRPPRTRLRKSENSAMTWPPPTGRPSAGFMPAHGKAFLLQVVQRLTAASSPARQSASCSRSCCRPRYLGRPRAAGPRFPGDRRLGSTPGAARLGFLQSQRRGARLLVSLVERARAPLSRRRAGDEHRKNND